MQATTISDGNILNVMLLDYGARIAKIEYAGVSLTLNYDSLDGYLHDPFYLGATIGPIANRIKDGSLDIQGKQFQMPINEGSNTLHSGGMGFDKEIWQRRSFSRDSVEYQLEYSLEKIGMRGSLNVIARYTVENGALMIRYQAHCDQVTFINFTNHVYLNLDGLGDITKHDFELFADSYVQVDNNNIPTGKTIRIDSPMAYQIGGSPYPEFSGFCDHHFNTPHPCNEALYLMLSARSSVTNIGLDVSGNSPGFQFYTGRFLSEPFIESGGFCVETQLPPDAINQENFDSPLLAPGQTRNQITKFQFSHPI